MRSLILIGLLVLSFSTHASLKVLSASGVSSIDTSSGASPGVVTIYGGTAGPVCKGDGQHTCSSCSANLSCTNSQGIDQSPFCACNAVRIYDDLVLKINLKNSRHSLGRAIATTTLNSPLTQVTAKNNGDFVDLRWSEVCSALFRAPSCEGVSFDSLADLVVGIDENGNGMLDAGEDQVRVRFKVTNPGTDQNIFAAPNSEGVGNFSLYPGDRSAFLENLSSVVTFPALSYGGEISAMRVFGSEKGMDSALPSTATSVTDFAVDSNGTGFNSSTVLGLDNGKTYFFRLAMVDHAGNVVQFYPGANLPASCAAHATPACPYAVSPEAVTGGVAKRKP